MAKLRLIPILLLAVSMPRRKRTNSLTADAIMARVATNQDSSEKLRSQYIYQQHIQIISRKTKRQSPARRDRRLPRRPQARPYRTDAQQLTGRYWHKGKYEDFSGEPVPEADSTDGDLIHEFREDSPKTSPKTVWRTTSSRSPPTEQKTLQVSPAGSRALRGSPGLSRRLHSERRQGH